MAGAALALLCLVLAFALGVVVGRRPGSEASVPTPASPPSAGHRPLADTSSPQPVEPALPDSRLAAPIAPLGPARVALVIDDLGRSLDAVERFLGLHVPVTFSVLPFESQTAKVVEALRSRDLEYLCHLPMEGGAGADPGPGALVSTMSEDEIREATRRALDAVPGAAGVNNHMGSVLSANERAMRVVLEQLRVRELYFLDSRTSPQTVAYRLALELGVPAAQRQVFLDGERDPERIRSQFRRALEIAGRRGAAVVIGHPYPETLGVLQAELRSAEELGYRFVPLRYLLDREGGAGGDTGTDSP